jgi:DNA topoisomerase IB
MDPRGHLQATGIDAAGRKQYLYHASWRTHRDRQKFDSMLAFGAALPRLRRGVARDLRVEGGKRVRAAQLTELRVLACAVRLLDLGFFRIEEVNSYLRCWICWPMPGAGDGLATRTVG